MLSTQLLTQNNESSIELTLSSLPAGEILVGDMGSTDRTLDICEKYNAKIFLVPKDNRSDARNFLMSKSSSKWNLYVDPWEVVATGEDTILKTIAKPDGNSYNVYLVNGDMVTKTTRLWNMESNTKFVRPVYESLEPESNKTINCSLFSKPTNNYKENERLIKIWMNNQPLAAEPFYYQACNQLVHRKYKEFLHLANHYIFLEKRSMMPVIMTRYYISLVDYQVSHTFKNAIQHLIICLSHKPLMAEFWCALGDILFHTKDLKKSRHFYENAIILGSKREKNDIWPMEVSKYEEYPQNMIKSIDKITDSVSSFTYNAS